MINSYFSDTEAVETCICRLNVMWWIWESPKIRVFPSGILSQTLNSRFLCFFATIRRPQVLSTREQINLLLSASTFVYNTVAVMQNGATAYRLDVVVVATSCCNKTSWLHPPVLPPGESHWAYVVGVLAAVSNQCCPLESHFDSTPS